MDTAKYDVTVKSDPTQSSATAADIIDAVKSDAAADDATSTGKSEVDEIYTIKPNAAAVNAAGSNAAAVNTLRYGPNPIRCC